MALRPKTPVPVGRALRRKREALFLTQSELAEKLGVSLRTVNAWEAGTTKPYLRHRKALLEFFHPSLEEAA